MRRIATETDERKGVMRLSHRLVAMHAAGVALLIFVVLSSVLWISAEHNKLALESSESLVRGGITSFRVRLRTLVKDYSIWDEAYDAVVRDDRDWLYSNIGNAAAEIGTLDMIVFVPPGGTPFGWTEGSDEQGEDDLLPPLLLGAILRLLDTATVEEGAKRTLLADLDGEPWAFTVATVTPVDGVPTGLPSEMMPRQIHGLRLSGERLEQIGRNLLVDGLSLASAPTKGQAAIPLEDYAGSFIRFVVWDPPRPAGDILRKVALPLSLALLCVAIASAVSSTYAVRSAKRLERALYDAKAADRSKTEFLSNVSHELRTPMNGILGVAQLLQTTDLDAEQTELVAVLFASATAQMALISDLLDISRMESGNRALQHAPFEPAAVLKDVTEMMRVAADKKKIAFSSDFEAVCGLVARGDERAFRQIITNLLGNAVKFTDRGGVELRVGTDRGDGRARLIIDVADTGRGIPAEALPHIFERFYQVDSSLTRGTEGTGLGLAISQNLARLMDGQIVAESEAGKGSTFSLVVGFDVVRWDGTTRNAA